MKKHLRITLLAATLTFALLASACQAWPFVQLTSTVGSTAPSEETATPDPSSLESEIEFKPSDAQAAQVTETQPVVSESGDNLEENINAAPLTEDELLTETAPVIPSGGGTDPILPVKESEQQAARDFEIVRTFAAAVPESVVLDLQYTNYQVFPDYILIRASGANVRALPDTGSPVVAVAGYFEKVAVLAEVRGQWIESYQTDLWYEVIVGQGENAVQGFVLSSLAELRTFQFSTMVEEVLNLQTEVEKGTTAFISNYKNWTGTAPLYNGQTVDPYGMKRYQAAPAYVEASTQSDFRYMPDGTLVSVLAQTDNYYKVSTLNFPGEYYVPKKYVSFQNEIRQLSQVIVIDRKNQNEGVFEWINGQWHLISFIYATTGEEAQYKEPTLLGHYMAIQRVDRFLYLDDVTREIAGYAPYAIRFNGGAYIHGVPVDLSIVNGVKTYPPHREYLHTIGTDPRSHKCVRNYTSHAKFLHEWIRIGEAAVIVIE